MKLALRKLRGEITPAAGELVLKPADLATRERRDIANLAVSQGPDAFLRGQGEITTIVTSDDPTLDDLLGFEFVSLRLQGKPLPKAAAAFARYAALAREGLRPSSVALDHSMEGIFLAIRNAHGSDLTQPLAFAKFEGDWQRMASHIVGASERGADPFKEAIFSDAPDFARERTFLAKDRDVYLQDVLRGERWLIKIAGGPPQASALIIRDPKSLLWKHWSRADAGAPTGDLYLLLGVDFGNGSWVFSTDPVQRLPIKELAEKLQTAELIRNPEAKSNPWFDGAPFGYTLVAAPKGGSKLANDELLKVVRLWCNATAPKAARAPSGAPVGLLVGAACVAVLAALGALLGPMIWGGPTPDPIAKNNTAPEAKEVDFLARGAMLDEEEIRKLPAAVPDAGRLFCLLRDRFGYKTENIRLLVDEPERCLDSKTGRPLINNGIPTRENVSRTLEELSKLTGRYEKGDRTNFLFYYAGHGETEKRASEIGYLILSGYWESDKSAPDVQAYNMGHLSRDIREKIHSSHQILLIDCCFSGFVTKARGNVNENPQAIYELWKSKAHAIVTAGSEKQRSFESGEKSIFSGTLFRALGGESESMLADVNKDGLVTDAELAAYLSSEVPKQFAGSKLTQTPQYHRGTEGDDVGQFLFIPRK